MFIFFQVKSGRARLPILALEDNAAADNDDDYDDDMLITGVKIIIIIAAVGVQMYNSLRCNYIRRENSFQSKSANRPLPSTEPNLFPRETSAP